MGMTAAENYFSVTTRSKADNEGGYRMKKRVILLPLSFIFLLILTIVLPLSLQEKDKGTNIEENVYRLASAIPSGEGAVDSNGR